MWDALAVVGLIATSYAATNVDNLALLVGWLVGQRRDPSQVLKGHLAGSLVLLLLACAFGLGAKLFPAERIGYLGLVPIGLGLKELYGLSRARPREEAAQESRRGGSLVIAIASTQVANGVDTVLVVGPLLADSELGVDLAMVVGFLAMSLLWYQLARALERQSRRLALLDRYGPWIAPIVLIAIGLYILDNTRLDVLPGS